MSVETELVQRINERYGTEFNDAITAEKWMLDDPARAEWYMVEFASLLGESTGNKYVYTVSRSGVGLRISARVKR